MGIDLLIMDESGPVPVSALAMFCKSFSGDSQRKPVLTIDDSPIYFGLDRASGPAVTTYHKAHHDPDLGLVYIPISEAEFWSNSND